MSLVCTVCDAFYPNKEESKTTSICKGHKPQLKEYDPKQDQTLEQDQDVTTKIYYFARDRIIKLVKSDNDNNQIYALVQVNANDSNSTHIETMDMGEQRIIDWLRLEYHRHANKSHSDESYKSALSLIRSESLFDSAGSISTATETIYNRVAQPRYDEIYYDLASPQHGIVKISKERVEILKLGQDTPVFITRQHQKPQFTPIMPSEYSKENDKKNPLEEYTKLFRIQNKQLFQVHLCCMFLEKYPIPIMTITGEHGSAKTTTTRGIKMTVDPSTEKVKQLNTKDFSLTMSNRYLIPFDNVSSISQETSDMICGAITGTGDSKRALYTNSDETIYTYKRKIVLNGIVPSINYADYQDRNISYETLPVPPEERKTEEVFNTQFEDLLPYVLGQVFDTLSRAFTLYDDVKPKTKNLPRMADFGIFGECISQSLGYKENSFLQAYNEKMGQDSRGLEEKYPLIQIIPQLSGFDSTGKYQNEVKKFLDDVKSKATDLGIELQDKEISFPKSANKVRGHITQILPTMRKIGIHIDIQTVTRNDEQFQKGNKVITITRLSEENGLF